MWRREPVKYNLADFFRNPPHTPLAENLFAQKSLAELGGTLPPLLNRKYFSNFSLAEKGGTPLPPLQKKSAE